MYKEDLTLNNQQWLICHKTQPNQIKLNSENFFMITKFNVPCNKRRNI